MVVRYGAGRQGGRKHGLLKFHLEFCRPMLWASCCMLGCSSLHELRRTQQPSISTWSCTNYELMRIDKMQLVEPNFLHRLAGNLCEWSGIGQTGRLFFN